MTKIQAEAILNEIHLRSSDKVNIEQGVQLAVNNYVDNALKLNPKWTWGETRQFDKRSENMIKAFQHALRNKLKEIRIEKAAQSIPKQGVVEEKFILSEVCRMLDMTPQNLNHLLRNHKDILVIEVSSRKRYMTKMEIDKLRKIGRK